MGFDIESIKRKMLVKYPFFGSVVANVDYRVNKNIPTAGTDGKVIYYNPDFLEKLSVEEQTFIFAHEVCHIAFNHILRSEGKDPAIWNTATDAVINAFLKRDGLKMVKGGVDMADAINYDAEQLYEKLLQEKQQQQQQGQGQGNQSQQQNGQQGQQGQSEQNQSGQGGSGEQNQQEQSQDSQSQSQNGQGQSQNSESQSSQEDTSGSGSSSSSDGEEQEKQQSGSQGGGGSSSDSESREKKSDSSSGSGDSSSQEEKQDVGHDTHSMWKDAIKNHNEEQAKNDYKSGQNKIEQLGEKEAFNENLKEYKKELEKLKKALSRQAMGPGSSTNRDVRNITDIGRAKPLIDWRYVLREAINYDVDYRNATIEDGVISTNLEEQPMPETEIVLDTSGSINETLLKNFLRECKNILQHSRLKVGCFDTEFYGFHEIRTEEDIENMRFEGGGGTNFDVAVGAFSRRVESKIIFTDGDAHMPDMPLDAIWIVFGGIKINPKGGKVIQIGDEQLDELYYYVDNSPYKRRGR